MLLDAAQPGISDHAVRLDDRQIPFEGDFEDLLVPGSDGQAGVVVADMDQFGFESVEGSSHSIHVATDFRVRHRRIESNADASSDHLVNRAAGGGIRQIEHELLGPADLEVGDRMENPCALYIGLRPAEMRFHSEGGADQPPGESGSWSSSVGSGVKPIQTEVFDPSSKLHG